MDFRKLAQKTDDYLTFKKKDEPDKDFTCKEKINPSTCHYVIVFGGLNGCLKCKNFIEKKFLNEDKNSEERTVINLNVK